MNSQVKSGLKVIPDSFFCNPPLEVAEALIDRYLLTKRDGVLCGGRIVENEAYLGEEDPASHAACGPTERNKYMFGSGGVAYVYLIYGMHRCFNVTAGNRKQPGAVLIRALEPEYGIEKMKNRRGVSDLRRLTTGPANLAEALGIGLGDNGRKLPAEDIFFASGGTSRRKALRSVRIGISRAKDLKYRFLASASKYVSAGRKRRKN